MATKKISEMAPAAALGGTELLEVVQGGVNLAVTPTQIKTFVAAEPAANKSLNVTTDGASDIKFPSVKAVKTYADDLATGSLKNRGVFDASGGAFPANGGSGTAGAILNGDMWFINGAGTLGAVVLKVGDAIVAITDTPAQDTANWRKLGVADGYVAENTANKVTSISGASTNTQYGSAKLLYDQLALKQNSGSYEVTTNKSTDVVTDAASDTKYPSVKATKTYADTKKYLHGVVSRVVGVNNPLPTNLTTPVFTLGATANPISYHYIGELITVDSDKTTILDNGTGASTTAGLLVTGKHYKIITYVPGDNFTNIATVLSGTTNTTGCIFTATNTTPTTWTQGSTVQNIATPGLYYIYFDAATGNILNGGFPGIANTSNVILATVNFNGTDYGLVNDERHSDIRDQVWHEWAHDTIGARYQSGITLTAAGTGAAATLATTAGSIHDEDIDFVVNSGTTCRQFWQNSATTYTFDKTPSAVPFKLGTGNRPVYVDSSNSYALTTINAAPGRFLNFFFYATTDLSVPIYMFVETSTSALVANGYTSLTNARAIPFPNLSGLGNSPELKPIYRVIVNGNGLVQTIAAEDDYRTVSSLPQSAGTVSTVAGSIAFTPYSTIAAGNVQTALEEVIDEKVNVTLPTVTVAEYADNAAASGDGLGVGRLYRTGDVLKVVHA